MLPVLSQDGHVRAATRTRSPFLADDDGIDLAAFLAVAARKMGAECFDVFGDARSGSIPAEQLRQGDGQPRRPPHGGGEDDTIPAASTRSTSSDPPVATTDRSDQPIQNFKIHPARPSCLLPRPTERSTNTERQEERGTCSSGFSRLVPPRRAKQSRGLRSLYNKTLGTRPTHTFLGLLAKINGLPLGPSSAAQPRRPNKLAVLARSTAQLDVSMAASIALCHLSDGLGRRGQAAGAVQRQDSPPSPPCVSWKRFLSLSRLAVEARLSIFFTDKIAPQIGSIFEYTNQRPVFGIPADATACARSSVRRLQLNTM
nr:unnamed protein product [Digitaria exilis]CAB3502470.1 unnamed protein product [Digitaria exilis]